MGKKKYTIALAQVSLNGTPEDNLAKCIDWTRKAADGGANVVCLPELYSSFYFCQSEKARTLKVKFFVKAKRKRTKSLLNMKTFSTFENFYKSFSNFYNFEFG